MFLDAVLAAEFAFSHQLLRLVWKKKINSEVGIIAVEEDG